ncbi:MAG: hypothetical protein A2271_03790 [Candidatus Moranbacteria bacterium RIFOXYA12_FULL_35_19]|nr:MAG: hypothetical protein A2489_03825 [Candidatus Moranbacteria bacterium RIFOXYC12_FULL_36_13]OGI36295.1 MAG: hypothetical protein A2271_03790 [Candidatus Moranbacteria bacterium RIFOXYA12_FULL_35_19]
MMSLISKFWNNFKNQPDIWFFFGFLLTFTLSIRKVVLYFLIQGTFNEYSGVFIYLSDVFLILTLVFWFISILCNDFTVLSRYRLWISSAFHKLYIFLPLFLVFLSFISILWSPNQSIALFRSFKLLEFYLLYIYIIFRFAPQLFHPPHRRTNVEQNTPHPNLLLIKEKELAPLSFIRRGAGGEVEIVPRGTFNAFSWIIILSGLFQATIGIIQFFLQTSVGLFFLKESLISPNILGVAKIILNGEIYIRAYGLMPHPNVLGGLLLFSIIITLLYKKMFHVEHQLPPSPLQGEGQGVRLSDVPRPSAGEADGTIKEKYYSMLNCSTWNNWIIENNWFFRLILAIQILALILTFSKSAIIGLLIALAYIIVPCGTFNIPFFFIRRRAGDEVCDCSMWNIFGRVEHLKLIILSILIILVSIFIIIKPNLNSLFFNSFDERVFYLNVPRGTFGSDPVLGIGAGQSVIMMQKFYSQTLEFWQYQPIHNVFLLIFSELGLLGLGLFVWWLWKLFHPPHRRTSVEQFKNSPHPNLLLIKEKELAPLSFIRRGAGGEVKIVPRGTIENNDYILHNNNTYLSSAIFSRYFTGILLGLIFIMLFDHYIWDIQQGSLLFWLTASFVAGICKKYSLHN